MTQETELKPCPFCGGEAKLVINNTDPKTKYGKFYSSAVHVTCMKSLTDDTTCHLMHCHVYSKHGELVDDEMIQRAIKKWNTRAEDLIKAELVDVLEDLIEYTEDFKFSMGGTFHGTRKRAVRVLEKARASKGSVDSDYVTSKGDK